MLNRLDAFTLDFNAQCDDAMGEEKGKSQERLIGINSIYLFILSRFVCIL